MTIEKGADWGSEVDRPADLVIAENDAELASLLAQRSEVAVAAGDVFTTIGARPLNGRARLRRLPIDLVHVRIDGGDPLVAVAHVVVRHPWTRGGWWRGSVLAAMNAEFIGPYDVAPRGHPNDGRVETFELAPTVGFRQRLAIRRRMRSGTHLPHPAISSRPIRQGSWTFGTSRIVIVDGVVIGPARAIEIDVEADAAHLYA